MADEPGEDPEGDEVLELKPEEVVPDKGTEEPEGEDDEVIISIGDEAAPASGDEAPEWVRDLRKRNRELERQLAEAKTGQQQTVPEVGEKPTLATCDYDEERFEQELDSWKERDAKAKAARTEAEQAKEEAQNRWNAKYGEYGTQKVELGVKDFDTAEEAVKATLDQAQQSILVMGASNKAQLVYALGKHPAKLQELAKIKDPIEFAWAASKLETQTKMERRPATQPETKVRGSASLKAPKELDDRLPADKWLEQRNAQIRARNR